jgi:putative flippase GtrA
MLGATLSGRASLSSLADLRPRRTPDASPHDGMAQLVRFASIGVVSTLLFGALFLLLAGPLGVLGADVTALIFCTIANTAANRRLTFLFHGRAGRARHYGAALALAALPLALTLVVLALAAALGITGLLSLLLLVTGANLAASLVRFAALRRWVFTKGTTTK